MTNKHITGFLLVLLAALAYGCASTTRVTPVSSVTNSGRGGVVYALPETVLDIVVPIDRVTETPPEPLYGEHTVELFDQPIEITKPKSSYSVGLPSISTSGQPDNSKVFYAQISGGPFSDSTMNLKLNAQGVLTSATVESENKAFEFVVSTFEAGAKIGGSFAKLINATDDDPCKGKPVLVCQAFNRIKEAVGVRSNILTGPGGDVATRLADLDNSVKKDLALFFGSRSKETWSAQFRLVPEATASGNLSLFSYSQSKGITQYHVTPTNRIGAGFQARKLVAERAVQVAISKARPLVDQEIASHRIFTQEKRGLHYNIPATATVSINDVILPLAASGPNKKEKIRLLTSIQSFAQFGSVGFLPVSTGSHKLHQEVTLDGTTGSLLAVNNTSNAFDPNSINKIGNATAGLMDALDPKVKAERERDMAKAKYDKLDFEKKIRDLEAETHGDSATAANR